MYQYDALNQLQRVDYPAYSEELFYDKAGNRARRLLDGEEELYQYDPRNRLMSLTRGGVTTPFQYDRAGNLLQDDRRSTPMTPSTGTVKAETFDGNVQVNRYDAEGLRHEMEENGNLVRFIFNPDREAVTEEDNTGLIRLVRATELIARSTDAVRRTTTMPAMRWGQPPTSSMKMAMSRTATPTTPGAKSRPKEETIPNRFTYYGQQVDPITQQYYLRARFYNPVIGRFTQEDTYRGDGLNLYAYCANNPVYYVDPSGYNSQNFTPYDYAKYFSKDLGRKITKEEAASIAIELHNALVEGRLTRIDGSPMNYYDKRRALDVAANLETGRIYWGLSGSTPSNPTRYGDALPEPIQNLINPDLNPEY